MCNERKWGGDFTRDVKHPPLVLQTGPKLLHGLDILRAEGPQGS